MRAWHSGRIPKACTLRNQACRDLSSCVRKQQKIPHFIDKTAQNQNHRAHPFGCLGGYFSMGISIGNYGLLARNIAICLLNTSIICCSWGWLRFTMSAM